MDNAEVYLLLTRISGVPVLGESGAESYVNQIELTDWSWEISSVEEEERATNRTAARNNAASRTPAAGGAAPSGGSTPAAAPDTAAANLARNQRASATQSASRRSAEQTAEDIVDLRSTDAKKAQWDRYSRSDQKSRIKVIVGRALGEVAEAASPDEDAGGAEPAAGEQEANQPARERNLTISFGKEVDVASTQMLNAMKGGEIFASAMISVFHRSATTPLLLEINLTKLRFTNYALSVAQSETMTTLKETWSAEFERFDYKYSNRPRLASASSRSQAAGIAASQGRTLVFVMKPRGLF
jgi:type VI protein secretion system component Hcp